MNLEIINGVACVKKEIDNIEVYQKLFTHPIKGTPRIIAINESTVYYEYINGTSLYDLINISHSLQLETVKRYIIDLCKILQQLSDLNIIHKDIKPENIVIDQNNDLFLIDFGVSRFFTNKSRDTTLLGTEGYASPEHYGFTNTTPKSDMFSFGMTIKEIDRNDSFKFITDKCCEFDPKNRYNNFNEIILDTNKIKSNSYNPKIEQPLSLKNYFNKPMKIIFIVLVIHALVMSIIMSREPEIPFPTILVLLLYFAFALFDLIDYFRILLFKRKYFLKIIKYKISISLCLFIGSFLLFILFITIQAVLDAIS